MKQVFIKKGLAEVEDIPAPQVENSTVLVQTHHSCISIGTEVSGVKSSGVPLWKQALDKPTQVKAAMDMIADEGLLYTYNYVRNMVDDGFPVGYSSAGVIVEVGADVTNLHAGDKVACAGAGIANHAEYARVPLNLVVPLPPSVKMVEASTVALGAIALQGIRRAMPTLGETFVVIGLGFLGQLTAQYLKLNGCRVIGTDLDPRRIELAEQLGMDVGLSGDYVSDVNQIINLTDGIGADGVIITAASASHEIVSTAFQMCRRKGRVVLVGDVGLNLSRADFYQKELDFYISTSYGPGRYDKKYELEGQDYPIGYVRWTEKRNMAKYLRLISEGRLNISPLIDRVFPLSEAEAAYAALQGEDRPLTAFFKYPQSEDERTFVHHLGIKKHNSDKIRLGLIGVGNFAQGVHVPNLRKLSELFDVQAVMNRTGATAKRVGKRTNAQYVTTDINEMLHDDNIDAVLISTRHDSHGQMVLAALEAGKHVLVEKPLTLAPDDLSAIEAFYHGNPNDAPLLMAGFNRRFSPYFQHIQQILAGRKTPMIVNYKMNAGYIPLDHWVHGAEGGGRNLGEGCHIYDLFSFLTDSRVKKVSAHAIQINSQQYTSHDNFVATFNFEDGSLATLTYTALGSKEYAKETMELFADGLVIEMDNYTALTVHGDNKKELSTNSAEKGHYEELEAFGQMIKNGDDWAIPLWQQIQATQMAFDVEEQITQ